MSNKLKSLDWRGWFYSLGASVIGGAANSMAAMLVDPKAFNFGDLTKLGQLFTASAVISLILFLKQSPLPTAEYEKDPAPPAP